MKKNSIITRLFLFSFLFPFMLNAQNNGSWDIKKGEKLKFKVAFSSGLTGDIKGGEAVMSVMPQTTKVGGNEAYHVMLTGATKGLIKMFYQVDNKYESFISTKTNAPLMFRQSVHENKYTSNDTVFFDQNKKVLTYKNEKMSMPANTQDFLSVFYYVRSLDMSKLKEGDSFTVSFFTSEKVANFNIIYKGIQKIKTKKLGEVSCYSFMPQIPTGKVFSQQYPATMWISADTLRLPVLVDAKMKVGKMKMELTDY